MLSLTPTDPLAAALAQLSPRGRAFFDFYCPTVRLAARIGGLDQNAAAVSLALDLRDLLAGEPERVAGVKQVGSGV